MAKEVERKFLVLDDSWKEGAAGLVCRQGYLPTRDGITVRVRRIGDQGFLTIKGKTVGISRDEYEYAIPSVDADAILATLVTGHIVEKMRYRIVAEGMVWDVDEFLGENRGLVLAEVELTHELHQVVLPCWVGREVTGDVRYYNAMLAEHPYGAWGKSEVG